jgi:hypothetical protein
MTNRQAFDTMEEGIIATLDEPFRSRFVLAARNVIERFKDDKDVLVVIRDGFRSSERQRALYAQGRTAPGKIVTRAVPGRSPHNYRRACHIILLAASGPRRNAWLADEDPAWHVIGQEVNKQRGNGNTPGLLWGGEFTTLRDMAHVEDFHWRRLAKHLKMAGMVDSDPRAWNKVELATEAFK